MPDIQPLKVSPEGGSYALPPRFDCSWARGGTDAACVHVAGELDIATTPSLERNLGEAMLWARMVVLDLRDLAFLAASGVNAILTASRRAGEGDGRLVVVRGSPDVDWVLALTGSSPHLDLRYLAAGRPPGQALLSTAERTVA